MAPMKTIWLRVSWYSQHLGWWKAESLMAQLYENAIGTGEFPDLTLSMNRADRRVVLKNRGEPILVLRGSKKGWVIEYDPEQGRTAAFWLRDTIVSEEKLRPQNVLQSERKDIYGNENFTRRNNSLYRDTFGGATRRSKKRSGSRRTRPAHS